LYCAQYEVSEQEGSIHSEKPIFSDLDVLLLHTNVMHITIILLIKIKNIN